MAKILQTFSEGNKQRMKFWFDNEYMTSFFFFVLNGIYDLSYSPSFTIFCLIEP